MRCINLHFTYTLLYLQVLHSGQCAGNANGIHGFNFAERISFSYSCLTFLFTTVSVNLDSCVTIEDIFS